MSVLHRRLPMRELVHEAQQAMRAKPLTADKAAQAWRIADLQMEQDAQAMVDPYMHAVYAWRAQANGEPSCGCSYCDYFRERRQVA